MSDQPEKISDVKMDTTNLYREESVTDLKVGGIRILTPIKLDGSVDSSREAIYSGHTQIMSPHGPVPIQGAVSAKNLEGAVAGFPQAMEDAMAKMIEDAQKVQREQASKIVTPDDLKKDSGLII